MTIILIIGILPIGWLGAMLAYATQGRQGMQEIVPALTDILNNPLAIAWTRDSPRFILIAIALYAFAMLVYYSTRKNLRSGEEHGSASWANAHALRRRYQGKKPLENRIFTQNFRMGLDGRKHRRNLNTLVVGGSGAGKTRFYAKPNILQANCSFIVSDPKSEILRDTGHLLEKMGYKVRVFDLINPEKSHRFNPFYYLKSDKDVLTLVTNIIKNTTPKGASPSEPFWEKAETALMQALMLYLLNHAPEEEQNFAMVMDLLRSEEVREDDPNHESLLDILFQRVRMKDPESVALKQYMVYKMAAGKTASSILVSLGVRLSVFQLKEIADLTEYDELALDKLGDEKTAIFCCIPDNDTSLNFLVGVLYTLAFQILYYKADREHNGRLPVHVHCMMDEFPNVALPDDFEKLLATMRSREISVSMIIQNMAQLKALFKNNWESLVGNADTLLYLGGNEAETHKYISALIGKATIDTKTYNQSKGRNGNYTTNFQISGRELLLPEEVRLLDNSKALLFIRGERPILDDKYNLIRHPHIKLSADGGAPIYVHEKPATPPVAEPAAGTEAPAPVSQPEPPVIPAKESMSDPEPSLPTQEEAPSVADFVQRDIAIDINRLDDYALLTFEEM